MKSIALTQFPWPNLVMIPLLLFFAIFVGVIIWSSLRPTQQKFQKLSQLPLEGEENERL